MINLISNLIFFTIMRIDGSQYISEHLKNAIEANGLGFYSGYKFSGGIIMSLKIVVFGYDCKNYLGKSC